MKSRWIRLTAGALGLSLLASCTTPFEARYEEELREQVIGSHHRTLEALAAGPLVEVQRPPSVVEAELTPERLEQLDVISGPAAYEDDPLVLGPDLLGGDETQTVAMSLERAVRLAVHNNLDLQLARLVPAVSTTQVVQAEAAFDATFFASYDLQKLDTVTPPAGLSTFGSTRSREQTFTGGISKPLTTGGTVTIQSSVTDAFREPSFYNVDEWYDSDLTLNLNQPLLQGFGAAVNTAQIELARSAREQSIADLKAEMLSIVAETEAAYWNLVFARQRLSIQSRLLDRTIEDRDRLTERRQFDVSPVQLTEANSFVELRRADVIRARQQVRVASDRLKQLIKAPELPIAGETLVVPVDRPADAALQFSLRDAVISALRHRPETLRALLEIDDASIRQRVADNLRLPQLDLSGTIRYNGTGEDPKEAYDVVDSASFIDYLLTLEFRMPIGNRAPQALHRQRQLERQAAVLNYRRVTDQVVLQVKQTLRNVLSSYELIGAARSARRAAADNLRAIEEQERAGAALTPEFLLDLKLATQQRLAQAEIEEAQALVDYNTAVTGLYQAMGTLLERNGIELEDVEYEN